MPEPLEFPDWLSDFDLNILCFNTFDQISKLSSEPPATAPITIGPSLARVSDIFDVAYGVNLELVRLTKCSDGINFVSRTARNNGVTAKVALVNGIAPISGGALSVAGGGSVLETFVQLEPFYSGRDLFVLRPKDDMGTEELMFYAACLRANQW